MIFAPANAQASMTGVKTMTRRLIGEWDQAEYDSGGNIWRVVAWPSEAHKLAYPGRTRYEVGKSYAIQPGRGLAGIGKFKLLSIRRERVNEISEADAIAEGVELRRNLGQADLETNRVQTPYTAIEAFEAKWDSIHGPGSFACGREVWVLRYEVCK